MTTQTAKPPAPVADDPVENKGAAIPHRMEEGPWGFPVVLDLRPLLGGKSLAEVDVDVLEGFFRANDLYAIEYNETGELIVMPPMLMPGGNDEATLITAVTVWRFENGGVSPSSTTIFRIAGLGGRGPDASWVSPERLAQLDPEQYRTGQVCPDFVAEIRSPGDSLAYLRRKMDEYMAAGVRLGWLIDPRNRRVTVYRPGQEPEELENPETLSGEEVMPGFEFRVRALIFDAAPQ